MSDQARKKSQKDAINEREREKDKFRINKKKKNGISFLQLKMSLIDGFVNKLHLHIHCLIFFILFIF